MLFDNPKHVSVTDMQKKRKKKRKKKSVKGQMLFHGTVFAITLVVPWSPLTVDISIKAPLTPFNFNFIF